MTRNLAKLSILAAHIEQTALLSPEQAALYGNLRGYSASPTQGAH